MIPELAVRRPVAVGVALLTISVLGLVAWSRLPVALLPRGYEPGFLMVDVPLVGEGDQEREVAIPLERAALTMPGVQWVRTLVRPTRVELLVRLGEGLLPSEARATLRERIMAVELPEGTPTPRVWAHSPRDAPVLWLAVTVPPGMSREPLERLLVWPVSNVPGVSRVDLAGLPSPTTVITLDPSVSLGVTARQVRDALARFHGGAQGVGQTLDGHRVVVTGDRLEDLVELRVGPLRLGDIATIEERSVVLGPEVRVDGHPAVTMAVYQASGADTARVTDAAMELVHRACSTNPGLEASVLFDQGAMVREAMGSLRDTGLIGGLLATAVLLLFFRGVVGTIVVLASIPFSLLVALLGLWLARGTLDILSSLGLMLATGMVVDDAIVVAESIQTRLVCGEPRATAAIRGASSVSRAIVAGTATTAAAFLPVLVAPPDSEARFFLAAVGLPLTVALAGSLAAALLAAPAAVSVLGPRAGRVPMDLGRLRAAHRASLAWVVDHPVALALVAASVLAGFWLVDLPVTDRIAGDLHDLKLGVTGTEEDVATLEARLLERRDSLGLRTIMLTEPREGSGRFTLLLERGVRRAAVARAIGRLVPPGLTTSLSTPRADLEAVVSGPDMATAREAADRVARAMERLPGVVSVALDQETFGQPELLLDPTPSILHAIHIDPTSLAREIRRSVTGDRVSWGGRSTPVIIRGPRPTAMGLERAEVPGGLARGVPLGQVATMTWARSTEVTVRQGGTTVVGLGVLADEGVPMAQLSEALSDLVAGVPLPGGCSVRLGDRIQALARNTRARGQTLAVAVFLVFAVMAILLDSLLLPLIAVMSIPFGLLGALLALDLAGLQLDVMASVGLVVLVGIVVNNGIVLVDRMAGLVREGMEPREAALVAGSDRLRPVLMTAATTVAGLIPMASGTRELAGNSYSPLAVALIGGMALGTVATLWLTPWAFSLVARVLPPEQRGGLGRDDPTDGDGSGGRG